MGGEKGLLIILGVVVLYLRRIAQKSARVERAWEGIYAVVNPIANILLGFITLFVAGSIWIALLISVFLYFFKVDHVFALMEIGESILEEIADFITEQPRKVKAYFARRRHYTVLPGSYLLRIGGLFLPKQHLVVLQEEIGDMRRERREALNARRYWRARIIVWVYYIGIAYSALRFMGQKSAEVIGFIPKPKD